jgi:hypothetical protein
LHDFQASAAVEDNFTLAEIGVESAGLEVTEAHLPGDGAGT